MSHRRNGAGIGAVRVVADETGKEGTGSETKHMPGMKKHMEHMKESTKAALMKAAQRINEKCHGLEK